MHVDRPRRVYWKYVRRRRDHETRSESKPCGGNTRAERKELISIFDDAGLSGEMDVSRLLVYPAKYRYILIEMD